MLLYIRNTIDQTSACIIATYRPTSLLFTLELTIVTLLLNLYLLHKRIVFNPTGLAVRRWCSPWRRGNRPGGPQAVNPSRKHLRLGNHLLQLLPVCCHHGEKRWGGSRLALDRSNPSRKHVGNSPRSHNAVGWCRSTSSSMGGRAPHPWKRGPFRVVSRRGFSTNPTCPRSARSISTFSSVAAADRKCGPWCVRRWEPTGRISGSHPVEKTPPSHREPPPTLLPVYCRHAGMHPGRSETTLARQCSSK